MNKWEDSFKKDECSCQNLTGLYIPNRQLSAVVAGLLFVLFAVFMTGYFLGKKYGIEQFVSAMQQESFTDNVYTSVIATQSDHVEQAVPVTMLAQADTPTVIEEKEVITASSQEAEAHKNYYAQLIGFGTEKAAQQFVTKLATKGITTEVKKRTSKTVKGKVSYWYQVVTLPYADKHELATLVDKIAKEENLKDVCLKVC